MVERMRCPVCGKEMEVNETLSRGMGNQRFMECVCGVIVLVSGELVTQVWEPEPMLV
jgi:uncharacterized Zn finger protein